MVETIEAQAEELPLNWDMIQRRVLRKNSILQMVAMAGMKE